MSRSARASDTTPVANQWLMPTGRLPRIIALVLVSAAVALSAQYGIERFISDAATRLAYELRNEAAKLRVSGQTTRTFEHRPKSWPDGISGAYRIEIIEGPTSPRPGHRSIGVARNLTDRTWYATSYHLNFVEVPKDLVVSHQKAEPTIVTLELKDGKVLLTESEVDPEGPSNPRATVPHSDTRSR